MPGQPPPGQQQRAGTEGIGLALLGFGQDAAGELYVLGNINGTPFGSDGGSPAARACAVTRERLVGPPGQSGGPTVKRQMLP